MAVASGALADGTVVTDASGRRVVVNDASRIVSIGGAVTEILYELGLDGRVVAVDSTSLYPPAALRDKPNVGYMRALSAEGVLGLNPSLMLASEGSGPKDTIAILESASIPFVLVPDRFTGPGVLDKIRVVAQATGAVKQGACLADIVARDLAISEELRGRVKTPRKILFVLSMSSGRPNAAGRNTAADGIIRLAGGVNAIDGYEGYKIISEEAVIAARPDVVLVMQRNQGSLNADTLFSNPAFALTPAAERRAFIAMDGLYLLGFGPRTPRAARDLARAFYPELGSAAEPAEPKSAAEGCR